MKETSKPLPMIPSQHDSDPHCERDWLRRDPRARGSGDAGPSSRAVGRSPRATAAPLLFILLGAAGLALATACGPIETAGTGDVSGIVEHGVAVSEANALIAEARVSLSRPARVFVEYDNPLAGAPIAVR